MTQTAQDFKAEAAQHRKDAADSFERSDTDGFVSQWASGINAHQAELNAEIADAGGVWTFERFRLLTTEGELVADARAVNTRFGRKWRSDELDVWLPFRPKRESTLANKGFREVREEAVGPAKAITWSPPGARGLSGATSVQVIIIRTDTTKADGWEPVGKPGEVA